MVLGEKIEQKRPTQLVTQKQPNYKSRNDGTLYESHEMDLIFKFMYQVQILGKNPKQVDSSCFPERFEQTADGVVKYQDKKDYIKRNLQNFRILKTSDPESYY